MWVVLKRRVSAARVATTTIILTLARSVPYWIDGAKQLEFRSRGRI